MGGGDGPRRPSLPLRPPDGLPQQGRCPLITWTGAERTFEASKEWSRGCHCDYTGLSCAKIAAASGIRWPCDERYPNGRERLYEDGTVNTAADSCDRFGLDLDADAFATVAAHHGDKPERLRVDLFHGPRTGGLGLLGDLHDLNLLATDVRLCWTVLHRAARALRDQPLVALCESGGYGADRKLASLCTRVKAAPPQALVVT